MTSTLSHQTMKLIIVPALSFAFLLAASSAQASSRSSAAYTIPADTIEAGGRRVTSAAYTIDGSVGGIGGIGTVATTTAKHSYIGQLYDITNVIITASPATVNEGATRQLAATATLDDGTALTPAPTAVTWSVVNGPVTSVNASGVATAGLVYENTPATVQGSYFARSGTLGLTVLNVNLDNFGLYAGDTVDDAWQVQYFGLNNPLALSGQDPDGDGQINGYEYIVGTVPTDPNSLFRLRIEAVPGQPARKNLIFSPRFPSRTYTPEFRLNVEAGPFALIPVSSTADAGIERTVTDLQAIDPRRTYRIRITFP